MTGVALDAGAALPAGSRVSRVMVVLEDFDRDQTAAREGVELARAHGADVLFVDLPEPTSDALTAGLHLSAGAGTSVVEQIHLLAQRRQVDAMAIASDSGVSAQFFSVASPHDLAQAAQSQNCHVIVVAHPGRNAVMRLLSGNIVPMLITEANMPVLVCRPHSVDKMASQAAP